MLTISSRADRSRRFCNGLHRRDCLRIGSLGLGSWGLGSLGLAELLKAEDSGASSARHKSVIMVYLCGGPPHQDMFDLKVDAPAEIRGPFQPIGTSVPGIQICEHLPQLAAIADKLVFVRSMVGARDAHYSHQCMTGHHDQNAPAGGWPSLGAAASYFQGPVQPGIPPFVSLCYTTQHQPYNEPGPGFLGLGHSSFRPTGPSRDDMVLQGITSERLADRHSLLAAFDRFRRQADATGKMEGMDVFAQRAMGILTSSDLYQALDLSRESPETLERYGQGNPDQPRGDGAPRVPQNLLVARRLIEAGARVVTVNYSFWDWHGQNFKQAEEELPVFDRGVSALIRDLHERGLADDVSVVVWGEFGRTPQINKDAGRDHWPRVSCALLAGGGMRTGQVLGATDRLGGEAIERPVSFPEVFATLYHNLGINLGSQRLFDFRGRPHYLVDPDVRPLRELVG